MEFKSCGFASILNNKNDCPYTGKEKVITTQDKQIKCYADNYGSFRYVLYNENKQPISALQIEIREGINIATNVITIDSERRKGHSIRVYNEAIKRHKSITFSNNRSDLGKLYVKKIETF
jgi:hypothetical protein